MTNDSLSSFVVEIRFGYLNDDGTEIVDKPVTFKIDGERFKTSTRTVKFCTDSKYRITVTSRPNVDLDFIKIGGCTLQLNRSVHQNQNQYQTDWSTDGMKCSVNGKREDIMITLEGPSFSLTEALQCKFYERSSSHSEWGNKLEYILLKCSRDSSISNSIRVLDQEFR